jgi:hypothetical protein
MEEQPKRKADKVAIVGFAPSWKEAPFDRPPEEVEIWCLNEMYKVVHEIKAFRADRWFEIHDPNSPSKSKPEHQEFLRQCPCPIYMQKKYPDIPNSVEFPKDEIITWMESKGFTGSRYFTNSISWMIMFAAYLGFKEIVVVGVDMSTDSEWGYQKPSCEYMIGLCEGMGIKMYIPPSSELLKCGQLYGFEASNKLRLWVKKQIEELNKRSQQFMNQQEQAHKAAHQAEIAQAEIRGAKSAYMEWLKRSQ